MGRFHFSFILLLSFSLSLFLHPSTVSADLKYNYYADICPDVESIVRKAVEKKFNQTSVAGPATLRLFFHDCFVEGCDASIMIQSTASNKAEKDHPDNLSLAGDGFDTVVKAKEAVDEVSSCKNKVSCADILALATRDVVALAGGPSYAVELGRLDGLSSTDSSVDGKLPQPTFNLTQLNSLFAANGLEQSDVIALSAAHTIGFAHCAKFSSRIYNYSEEHSVDPTMNKTYAEELQKMCPQDVDPRIVVNMDPVTPNTFDNIYFKNLKQHKGLFTSDQVLYTDSRSKPTVKAWAKDSDAFNEAFITAMTNLGRVGVKTGSDGNIRHDCSVFNS